MILTRTDAHRELVARCCDRSVELGVRPGMTVAHARALVDVDRTIIEPHDAAADARGLRTLAAWAMRFTPVVAVDPPDGLVLDVTGCDRVFRGERRVVELVAGGIERLGFSCRVVVAPTFAAASALARHGLRDRAIIGADGVLDGVAPLPVCAARIDAEVVDAMAEVGLERIGQVMAVPREEIAARFGADVVAWIDRMMGRAFEPIDPVRAVSAPSAAREFAGPVRDVTAIERTVRSLIEAVCAELERRGIGAREVVVRLERSDLDPASAVIALSRPSADADHLWAVVRPRLERAHLGYGVDRVEVTAAVVAPVRPIQREHWADPATSGAHDAQRIGEMIDIMAGRLGPGRITMVHRVGSHLAERAFRHESAIAWDPRERCSADDAGGVPPRPTRLFDHPEPARVIAVTPDGPPYRIEWRGAAHEIVRAVGPERIGSEWWTEPAPVLADRAHDCFRVCTSAGMWMWVRRDVGSGGDGWVVRGEWI